MPRYLVAAILSAVLCALAAACPKQPADSTAAAAPAPAGSPAAGTAAVESAPPAPVAGSVAYPAEQWWGDGCDPHNQGSTAATGPDSEGVVASVDVGDLSGHLGLLPSGAVVVGRRRGVTVLTPTGETAWELDGVGDEVDFAISLEPDPRVYLRCNSYIREEVMLIGQEPGYYVRRACRLIALDQQGGELWRRDLEGSMLGMPCVDRDGDILGLQLSTKAEFHETMGHMESYSELPELARVSADGFLEWQKILPRLEGVAVPPEHTRLVMLRDGKVGFTWVDQEFHVFNAESFREWDYSVVSVPDCPPAVSPTTRIIQLANDRPELAEKQLELMNKEAMNVYGVLHSIKAGGTKHWDLQAGSDVHTAPAIGADGSIHFATTMYHDDRAGEWAYGQVICLNEKGQLQYRFDMEAEAADYPLGAAPLVDAAGTLYVADAAGNLYAVRADGELKWRVPAGDKFVTNPVIAGGVVYAGADDGKVYIIGGE